MSPSLAWEEEGVFRPQAEDPFLPASEHRTLSLRACTSRRICIPDTLGLSFHCPPAERHAKISSILILGLFCHEKGVR
jgi:hypothetical protein